MLNSWTCVDANLITRLLVNPNDQTVQQLWTEWHTRNRQLVAPALLRYEVTNALYRYQKQGLMDVASIQLMLKTALVLPIHLYNEATLHEQAVNLATRFSLPAAYDAHYLALAEQLAAEFWTSDRRLFQAVNMHLPWVHFVGV